MSSSVSAVFDVCNFSERRDLLEHGHTPGIKMEVVRGYSVFDDFAVYCQCSASPICLFVTVMEWTMSQLCQIFCVMQVEKVKPLRAVIN